MLTAVIYFTRNIEFMKTKTEGAYQGLATWFERRARAGVNSDDKEKEKGL